MIQKLVILGSGESGTGAAILGKKMGWQVFVSDKAIIAAPYKQELIEWDIAYEEGIHTIERILSADLVIKSPGIPDTIPLMVQIQQAGIKIISEIEFAARYTNAKLIGITGTNGKSTTTSLTYYILKKAGLNVAIGGNIGLSFARQVAEKNYDVFVLEISSFQLDNCYETRFDIAVLLNITPDHLDRYNYKLENYIASKFRIAQNQTPADYFIYNADDEIICPKLDTAAITGQKIPFSLEYKKPPSAYSDKEQITINITSENQSNTFNMALQNLALVGKHNIYNSMAAAVIANAMNIRKEVIRESLADFQNLEHRMEFVAKVKGISFINDSKATNVNSAWFALESYDAPIIWIAGGVDKGNDYNMLSPLIKEKVRLIVCLGLDNRKIHEAFSKDVDMILNTSSMQEAVKVAFHMAEKDETVLLSPACASFDLFENYEDRGQQFKHFVRNL